MPAGTRAETTGLGDSSPHPAPDFVLFPGSSFQVVHCQQFAHEILRIIPPMATPMQAD
jgi:hypothetical protein